MSSWTWCEYFETAQAPDGTPYQVVSNGFNPADVKRVLRDELGLIEHLQDERRFIPSDRLQEYTDSRAIRRGSRSVVDPRTGERGTLWLLRSTRDPHDKIMMLDWSREG